MASSKIVYIPFLLTLPLVSSVGCQKKKTEEVYQAQSPAVQKHLYVASGACYSGAGITTFSNLSASNMIYRLRIEDGVKDQVLADYNSFPAAIGDTPTAIESWENNKIIALVRNGTSAQRFETIEKNANLNFDLFGTNPTIAALLPTTPKAITRTSDGGLLITRTGFVERIDSSGNRPIANWVNSNLGATCGTANSLLTSVAVSPSGKIVTANAAASPNNRLISVPASGASGTCLSALAAPDSTTHATAIVMDNINSKVLVAYGGPTLNPSVNSIFAYDFNDSTGAISNPQKIYDANEYPLQYSFLLYGISAMTLDDGYLFVATAISNSTTVTNYAIEKLKYSGELIGVNNTGVLKRVGTEPFYGYGFDTKCISALKVIAD